MQHNNPHKPRGGCPSRLANDEIPCLYCNVAVARLVQHRTCSLCAGEWAAAFGPNWFDEQWHTALLAEHVTTFGGNGRGQAVSLDAQPIERLVVATSVVSTDILRR